MVTKKKTKAELLAYHKAQVAKLEGMSGELSKTSPGVADLITAFDRVVKDNKCSATDLIKNLSRLKKLGLKMESPDRKPRVKKIDTNTVD